VGFLEEAAGVVLDHCMRMKPGETVLVVTDEPCLEVGHALWAAARDRGLEAVLTEILPRRTHGQEPPVPVAEAMKAAAVALLCTSRSLSHTRARKEACAAGCRIASLPGITPEIMARALTADYDRIAAFTRTAAALFEGAREIELSTPSGTRLALRADGRPIIADTGLYGERGAFGNLPAGEVYLAPVEGTAEGRVVVDGSLAGIGLVDEPVEIEVERGLVVRVAGGRAARRLEELLEAAGPEARNVAELGVGTNDRARLTGNVLEDEKVLGTAHVAFGANATFGGKVSVASHLDGMILRPTILVDGRTVMRDGRFSNEE